MCSADIFLGLLAILFPPLPVWVKCGICSADSVINILLCCLGFVPGLFHAWYIIAKYPEPPYEYEVLNADNEGGRVTYVYVQTPHGPACGGSGNGNVRQQQPRANGGMNYGTHDQGQGQQQAEGSSGGVPPSYADVVAGDNKVQS
ncbi:hypothetical protein DCS_02475 [Drechmeria coniospora]|uniref:Stress response RCI peptide n=1 Tax=Drechmeria coniospora TaxID=98403 RepID=A0A151GWB0_DRECN|nr:hypothetical protein DCS_02475 [Drechmeria coniospora]KYK61333.1 hypothetical protein DCS_02475 [Drechmeria coniospora]ODA81099.1 hypothetical protein RJ55_04062 [Drechmeria coniospora]